MSDLIHYFGLFLLFFFMLVWFGYTISLFLTIPLVLKVFDETKYNDLIALLNENAFLPITTITPAFNEMHRISNTIDSILKSNYKNIRIIIVNDGSTDKTLQYLIDTYALKQVPPAFKQQIKTGKVKAYYQSTRLPNMLVIDKEHSPYANSGADCINAGLNACSTPLFLTIDSDTIMEPEAIPRMLFTYLTRPHCIAIGGNIYVPDKTHIKEGILLETRIPKNLTLASQVVEYIRSFTYGHEAWTKLGGALCHAGAFTMLEKEIVMEVGGYDAYNFSYDAEIIMKLHHYMRKNKFPYSIAYASNAIAWADQPFTLRQLWKQRNYWQRGLLRCLFLHKGMLLNPRYSVVGLVGFPTYVMYEIVGPMIEGAAYIAGIIAILLNQVNYVHLAWLLLLAFGYLLLITVACHLIGIFTYNKYYRKRDVVKLLYLVFIEFIFYRPFRSICCLVGFFHYVINRFRGKAL